jgi:hypothetical protein
MPEITINFTKEESLKSGIQQIKLNIPTDGYKPFKLDIIYDVVDLSCAELCGLKIVEFYNARKHTLPVAILKEIEEKYAHLLELHEKMLPEKLITDEQIKEIYSSYKKLIEEKYHEAKEQKKPFVILLGESHASQESQLIGFLVFLIYRNLGGKKYFIEDHYRGILNRDGIHTSSCMHALLALATSYKMQTFHADPRGPAEKFSKLVDKYFNIDADKLSPEEIAKYLTEINDCLAARDKGMAESILTDTLDGEDNFSLVGCGFNHLSGIADNIQKSDSSISLLMLKTTSEDISPICGESKVISIGKLLLEKASLPSETVMPLLEKNTAIPSPYNNLNLYEKILKALNMPLSIPKNQLCYPEFIFSVMRETIKELKYDKKEHQDFMHKLDKLELLADIDSKAIVEIHHIQASYFPDANMGSFSNFIKESGALDIPPLLWAVSKGDRQLVGKLLARDTIDVNVKDDKTGETPLSLAIKLGHRNIRNDLLKKGAIAVPPTKSSIFKKTKIETSLKPVSPDEPGTQCCQIL